MRSIRKVAYFSMEIGLCSEIPTYSGGLGVLAGDTLRAAADLRVPLVAVTLLHRRGYCKQRLSPEGIQTEEDVNWTVADHLKAHPERVEVKLEGRAVALRAWRLEVEGHSGYKIPVHFLDTDLPENHEEDRRLTDYLYGGDGRYRLCQEAILGMGGIRMLRALGYDQVERYHMNEGHASLLAAELLREHLAEEKREIPNRFDIQRIRRKCVFTTHTPVPAGHDRFPMEIVKAVLEPKVVQLLQNVANLDGQLNMTMLALNLSHYVNGVARRHGEISRRMFAPYAVDSITNGAHARTWVAPPFRDLFDRHIPTWREDSFCLRNAATIPHHEIWTAHTACKAELLTAAHALTGVRMDPEVFTLGFARRAAAYKRMDLLFQDLNRLLRIHQRAGAIQILFAGKAHPHDHNGKEMIQRVFRAKSALEGRIAVAYLPDYDFDLCRRMVAGVDVWLNTPEPPLEASGTSGMKAAMNGVPSMSVLDGWWLEGWIEGLTGWAIGHPPDSAFEANQSSQDDALSLYDKLEHVVLPLFYRNRNLFLRVMRHCIALNGSFFNTQRMMSQYVLKAYFGESEEHETPSAIMPAPQVPAEAKSA